MVSTDNANTPFFSVLISTFNRRECIVRAINSLINQIENDYECIIIDDGSTDNTFDIVSDYCRIHNNFKYLYHSNRGHGLTRNAGTLASTGKYITFLDSDDEYLNEHLSIRKEILIKHPDIDLLYGKAKIIGNPYVPDMKNSGQFIHLDECIIGGTIVVKRTAFNKIGGFSDLRFGDDYEFFERVKNNNFMIKEIDSKTYIYHRDTPDSLCNNYLR